MDLNEPYSINARFSKFVQLDKYTEILGSCIIHKIEFFSEESKKQAAVIEKELYDLQLQQNNILRRQSELIYTLEDLWLREQSLEINKQLNKAAAKTDFEKVSDDKESKVDNLMKILISLVDERDKMLQDLDIERLREKEEESEINEEIYLKRRCWSQTNLSDRSTSEIDQTDNTSMSEMKSRWSKHFNFSNLKASHLSNKIAQKENCVMS